ncbi:MAG: hypothetical protein M3Z41_02350 [Candidatus Eremiobacteraeota bacterium]|nr:hypothetical protein [Candidatus Eremiobacteraeota bacterium]
MESARSQTLLSEAIGFVLKLLHVKQNLAAVLLVAAALYAQACSGSQSGTPSPSQSPTTPSSRSQLVLYLTAPGLPTSPPSNTPGSSSINYPFARFQQPQQILVFERGYNGTFAVAPASCPAPGTTLFTASFGGGGSNGPTSVLTVQSTNVAGFALCTFTISDSFGQTATVTAYWEGPR